jgi:hypothetical protein
MPAKLTAVARVTAGIHNFEAVSVHRLCTDSPANHRQSEAAKHTQQPTAATPAATHSARTALPCPLHTADQRGLLCL